MIAKLPVDVYYSHRKQEEICMLSRRKRATGIVSKARTNSIKTIGKFKKNHLISL